MAPQILPRKHQILYSHFIHKSRKLRAFAEAFEVDLGYSLLVWDATEAAGSSKMLVPL